MLQVEGMEAEVLSGARNEFGHKMWRHQPPLFNADNFARVRQDILDGTVSRNLFCVSGETLAEISRLRLLSDSGDWAR